MKLFLLKIWHLSLSSLYKIVVSLLFKQKPTLKEILIDSGQAKGLKMRVPYPLKGFYKHIVNGDYEEYLLLSLKQTTNLSGKTIWDVGAHVGYHTLLFAKEVGQNGKVISFEPNPVNLKNLEHNINLNQSISHIINIKNIALSDTRGEATFDAETDGNKTATSGSHLDNITPPLPQETYRNFKKIIVKTDTIDGLKENGLPEPDIIKIDVEGAEYLVLLGARKLVSDKKPIFIIEIHNLEMMMLCSILLNSANYDIKIIDKESPFITKNILAIPKND